MSKRAITSHRILCFALLCLLIYSLLTGLTRLAFGGFMDFPCFVDYDEQHNCVTLHGPGSTEGEGASQIEVFLTTHVVGMHGGGCNSKQTDTNILDVPTSVIDLRFERDGDSTKINGQVLEPSAEFQVKDVFDLNPWTISRLRLKNLGMVADCQQGAQHQMIVIIGSYGKEISIIKGISISAVLVVGLVLSSLKVRSLRSSTPN